MVREIHKDSETLPNVIVKKSYHNLYPYRKFIETIKSKPKDKKRDYHSTLTPIYDEFISMHTGADYESEILTEAIQQNIFLMVYEINHQIQTVADYDAVSNWQYKRVNKTLKEADLDNSLLEDATVAILERLTDEGKDFLSSESWEDTLDER